MSLLHNRQQEDVVRKTPHSFTPDNEKGVKIVARQKFLFDDEHRATEKLRNYEQDDSKWDWAVGVAATASWDSNVADFSDAEHDENYSSPVVAVLLPLEEDDREERANDYN